MAQRLKALASFAENPSIYDSQHPHGGSQHSITPVLGNPIKQSSFLTFSGTGHACSTHMYMQANTFTHKTKINLKKN